MARVSGGEQNRAESLWAPARHRMQAADRMKHEVLNIGSVCMRSRSSHWKMSEAGG